ncbi:MAG: hypothetical protein LBU85_05755 [Treponema sp.]|nr:hypothetical protein [Treponema sp.]
MNTSISLDINVFREAEREADHLRISVPELCSIAIQEFVKNNNEKSETTKQLDTFYSTHKAIIDDDILQAQYDLLGEEEWEW